MNGPLPALGQVLTPNPPSTPRKGHSRSPSGAEQFEAPTDGDSHPQPTPVLTGLETSEAAVGPGAIPSQQQHAEQSRQVEHALHEPKDEQVGPSEGKEEPTELEPAPPVEEDQSMAEESDPLGAVPLSQIQQMERDTSPGRGGMFGASKTSKGLSQKPTGLTAGLARLGISRSGATPRDHGDTATKPNQEMEVEMQ